MSPRTKTKTKKVTSGGIPRGLKLRLRKELGVNLSNHMSDERRESESELQKSIKDFFDRDDVTRLCPAPLLTYTLHCLC